MQPTMNLAALAVAVLLGACVRSPTTVDHGRPVDSSDAYLDFVRCLREEGMDVPDPEPHRGSGAATAALAPDPQTDAERRAIDRCTHFLGDTGSQQDRARTDGAERADLFAFASCMRTHGIDYPDPVFLAGGAIDIKISPDVDTPAFDAAQEACRELGGYVVVDGNPSISGNRDG